MMSDQEMNELHQIEQYLAGHLSAPEQQKIDEKIENDSAFSTKVENMRQVTRLLRTAHIEQRAQHTLQQLYRQQRQRTRQLTYYRYGFGLSAIAACFAWLLFLAFADVHLPIIEDDLMLVRGKRPPVHTTPENAPYSLLLSGQQEFRDGNYLKASEYFKKVLDAKDLRPYYRQAAQWYLTLAYLSSDQPRLAEHYYQQVEATDNPEFVVSKVDQWKVYVQIQRRKFL